MNTKTIPYISKRTRAGTEYREISRPLKKEILDQLENWDKFYNTYKDSNDPIAKPIIRELQRPRKQLPKHGEAPYGYNSMQSFTRGVLDNCRYGSQRDFSHKTCDGIEKISEQWAIWAGTDSYKFSNRITTSQRGINNVPRHENTLFTWE